jgi:cytochrome c
MLKTVLVATDGSDHARKASALAGDLADRYGARVVVVHVLLRGHLPEGLRRMAEVEHLVEPSPGALPNVRLVMPIMNPARGGILFVAKGCVACHAINGVGGHDAPMMDAHSKGGLMNPFDFAAQMWNHAPGMIAAQEEALGEQVYFTGSELADITAFVHDDSAQHKFSEADLTPAARKMMQHQHGGEPAPRAHAKEIGHDHAPGTHAHED